MAVGEITIGPYVHDPAVFDGYLKPSAIAKLEGMREMSYYVAKDIEAHQRAHDPRKRWKLWSRLKRVEKMIERMEVP